MGSVATILLVVAPVLAVAIVLLALNRRDGGGPPRGDYNDPCNFIDDRFEGYPKHASGWGGGYVGPEDQYEAEHRDRH